MGCCGSKEDSGSGMVIVSSLPARLDSSQRPSNGRLSPTDFDMAPHLGRKWLQLSARHLSKWPALVGPL